LAVRSAIGAAHFGQAGAAGENTSEAAAFNALVLVVSMTHSASRAPAAP
jgi:hypothetical protein